MYKFIKSDGSSEDFMESNTALDVHNAEGTAKRYKDKIDKADPCSLRGEKR